MSRMQREKGKRGERECVALLKPLYADAQRCSQYRGGKQDGADVRAGPFVFECKVGKSPPSPFKALAQIERDVPDAELKGAKWRAAYLRRDRGRGVIVMRADDFTDMLRAGLGVMSASTMEYIMGQQAAAFANLSVSL